MNELQEQFGQMADCFDKLLEGKTKPTLTWEEKYNILLTACLKVRDTDHQMYPRDPTQYQIGVADGHRCAAGMIKNGIKSLDAPKGE
jgi:hypothetical protein